MLGTLFRATDGPGRSDPHDLTGADDLDLDLPIESGAEDEVRALLFETPVSIADREPDWLDITAPRVPKLPPRVPKASGRRWIWLALPGALGAIGALSAAAVCAFLVARG